MSYSLSAFEPVCDTSTYSGTSSVGRQRHDECERVVFDGTPDPNLVLVWQLRAADRCGEGIDGRPCVVDVCLRATWHAASDPRWRRYCLEGRPDVPRDTLVAIDVGPSRQRFVGRLVCLPLLRPFGLHHSLLSLRYQRLGQPWCARLL
jgi:hypothetical protein